mgnify:CR=1 FL=1
MFWYRAMYRTGSVHGLGGIGDIKVRSCFCIGPGGTWIGPDTKQNQYRDRSDHYSVMKFDWLRFRVGGERLT